MIITSISTKQISKAQIAMGRIWAKVRATIAKAKKPAAHPRKVKR
jgi:hypothetical protein